MRFGEYIPGTQLSSVQLAELPEVDHGVYDEELENKWNYFLEVRDDVLKALEEARKEKVIGNSLGAAVNLYPNEAMFALLTQFEQLDQLFIVSAVNLHPVGTLSVPEGALQSKDVAIAITVADGEKCERCWIVTPEVGHSKEHPTLCVRCNDVVTAHYHE